jgi:hypothetical protein
MDDMTVDCAAGETQAKTPFRADRIFNYIPPPAIAQLKRTDGGCAGHISLLSFFLKTG